MFKERRECWNERLRNSCKEVFSLKPLREYFFLTGSAALSVFWLGHRRIDNLDFFTVKDVDFTELGLYFKNIFSKNLVVSNEQYILIRAPEKISFAKDHLSIKIKRPAIMIDDVSIRVDTLRNLLGNKMSAFVSRFSRNDVFDVLCSLRRFKHKERIAAKMLLWAQKTEILAEDTSYIYSLLESVPEIYPDISTMFPNEIEILKETVKALDLKVEELYR